MLFRSQNPLTRLHVFTSWYTAGFIIAAIKTLLPDYTSSYPGIQWASLSQPSKPSYQTTRLHILVYSGLHYRCHQNLPTRLHVFISRYTVGFIIAAIKTLLPDYTSSYPGIQWASLSLPSKPLAFFLLKCLVVICSSYCNLRKIC